MDARLHVLRPSDVLRGGPQEHRDHGARAALGERGGRWARGSTRDCKAAFGDHPHAGDIRGGKGLLAAVELVEDRATKANFAADKKIGNRVLPRW